MKHAHESSVRITVPYFVYPKFLSSARSPAAIRSFRPHEILPALPSLDVATGYSQCFSLHAVQHAIHPPPPTVVSTPAVGRTNRKWMMLFPACTTAACRYNPFKPSFGPFGLDYRSRPLYVQHLRTIFLQSARVPNSRDSAIRASRALYVLYVLPYSRLSRG